MKNCGVVNFAVFGHVFYLVRKPNDFGGDGRSHTSPPCRGRCMASSACQANRCPHEVSKDIPVLARLVMVHGKRPTSTRCPRDHEIMNKRVEGFT